MSKPVMCEKVLWEGCCRQDRKAQHDLFVHFLPVMLGVCRRYTKSKMDAEDLVQDGFMHAFKHIASFNGGSLEGWLRRVFVNLCITDFRKRKRKEGFWLEINGESELEYKNTDTEWKHDFLATEQLLSFINSLPEGARMAFNLFAVEGFSHKEIADILNITESTSRVQVAKARRLLQNQINPIIK